MPRNSVSKVVEEIPKELKAEPDRIVMPLKLYNRMSKSNRREILVLIAVAIAIGIAIAIAIS